MEMEEADKLTKYLIENLRVSLLYFCSISKTQLRNLSSEISYLLGNTSRDKYYDMRARRLRL